MDYEITLIFPAPLLRAWPCTFSFPTSEWRWWVRNNKSYSCTRADIGFVADRFMISVPGSAVSTDRDAWSQVRSHATCGSRPNAGRYFASIRFCAHERANSPRWWCITTG